MTVGFEKYNFNFQGKVVLVVEDNMISFNLIDAMLSQVNISLIHASDGLQAISYCSNNPQISMVLMDIQLPEVNGLEATRRIKKIRPDLPVIATTANVFDEDEEACLAAGCAAYISKPIQFRRLFEIMQSLFIVNH